MVDFTDATNNLAEGLVDDGHLVVQCEHFGGHTVPFVAFNAAQDWISMHQFGSPSPLEATGLAGLENFEGWCEVVD